MIQKFDLKNKVFIDSLEDCKIESIEKNNNKLIFNFDRNGIDILMPNGQKMYPYNGLKVTYVLNSDFEDSAIIPSVKNIDCRKIFNKNIFKYYTLNQLIELLTRKNWNLIIEDQYYKKNYCLIKTEPTFKNCTECGNYFYIKLIVDEIIYEWI